MLPEAPRAPICFSFFCSGTLNMWADVGGQRSLHGDGGAASVPQHRTHSNRCYQSVFVLIKKKKNAPTFFFFFLFEKHTNPNRHTGTGGIFFSSWGEGGKVHVRPHIYICRVFVETGVWPPVTVLVHLAASTGAHINLFTLTFLCKHLRRSKPPLKKSVYTQRFYDPHSDRFR